LLKKGIETLFIIWIKKYQDQLATYKWGNNDLHTQLKSLFLNTYRFLELCRKAFKINDATLGCGKSNQWVLD